MSDAKDVTIDSAPGPLPSTEKSSIVFNSNAVDTPPAIGELTFEEYTSGGLGRHLGVFSTICLIVGRIIGTGIFSTPASVTDSVGSVGASLLLWVLGLLLAGAGLCVWLEFGCMIPRSGGEKVYLEAVYRRPKLLITVIFAAQAVALGFTASACIVFASYVVIAANRKATEWEERAIAIAVVGSITLLHAFSPRFGVRSMNAIGVIKIATVVFIVVTGWVILGGAVASVPDPYTSFRRPFAASATSSNQYSAALFKVTGSFAGWSNAAYVMNEIKNPTHTVKIAAPTALLISGTLYILANVSYYSAGTPYEIANSGVTVASFFMERVFGAAAKRALSVLVAISAFGNAMTTTFAQARVIQELAKEGVLPFPRFWAASWPFGSPSSGLFLHFLLSFTILIAVPFGDAYNFILDLAGYPNSIISLLVAIGLLYLRWSSPDIPRPFKVWWPVAFFFAAGQAFQLVAPFMRPPGAKGDTSLPYWLHAFVGIVVLLLGVVYWAVWQKISPWLGRYRLVPTHGALKDGTTVVAYKRVYS